MEFPTQTATDSKQEKTKKEATDDCEHAEWVMCFG